MIRHEPSQWLEDALSRFDKRWHKNSEKTTRTEIDLILLDVLNATPEIILLDDLNDTPETIGCWGEVELSWIDGPTILTGYCDYVLSYGELTEITDISSILVCGQVNCKEAQKKNIWHIVAYCGIVHKARIALGEYNKFVYGFMTDGDTWEFVCIDNASQVWTIKVSTLRKAMAWLRHILYSAQRASTPVAAKPIASKSNLRKKKLKNFNLVVERFRTKDGVHEDEVKPSFSSDTSKRDQSKNVLKHFKIVVERLRDRNDAYESEDSLVDSDDSIYNSETGSNS
ncbi:hypothetical protein BDK51DRAFT_51365 [Blyttiomyces helicus]|uniref:Uncharacterized protein n=1 Tax=Blyttiomyces helicus TaxID=388810 RepID=A0A4P9VWV2_9FUNG|nr:hypothetical protein BDK51DRAFT_51365 [Blyttiomyces helicus]|eukprot:RKO84199.1 hypothetical protein BDK51DRAFT_51365 [Blyttiomyces helicus]